MNAIVQFGTAGNQITTKRGKVIGERMGFFQGNSAAAVKAELRADGFKGRELTEQVNAVLRGETDLAWAKHDAAVSALRSAGYIPSAVEARKATGVVRYVRPVEAKAAKATVSRESALAALGLTEEQLAQLASLTK